MAVSREDPYGAFNFLVEIGGVGIGGGDALAGFKEATGLEVEVDPIEYRSGSERNHVRKLPGLAKYSNITLKRGVTGDLALWNWTKTVLDGRVVRADGTITLLDEGREPVLVWRFTRGWPCKYVGPNLNAKSGEVAIETLEICHEGLEIE